MIDDRQVSELPFDFESMTARDLLQVGKDMKVSGHPVTVQEIDADYHLYLFAQAVVRADSSVAITDVLRISAKDATRGAGLARDFFYLDSEEPSLNENSDGSSPILQ